MLLGKNSEVVDEGFGGGKAVNIDDFGDQDSGSGVADAGDGSELSVLSCGQRRISFDQQLAECVLGGLAVSSPPRLAPASHR